VSHASILERKTGTPQHPAAHWEGDTRRRRHLADSKGTAAGRLVCSASEPAGRGRYRVTGDESFHGLSAFSLLSGLDGPGGPGIHFGDGAEPP
jgi:hypothetical protein